MRVHISLLCLLVRAGMRVQFLHSGVCAWRFLFFSFLFFSFLFFFWLLLFSGFLGLITCGAYRSRIFIEMNE